MFLRSTDNDEHALHGIRRNVNGGNPSGPCREERLLRDYPSFCMRYEKVSNVGDINLHVDGKTVQPDGHRYPHTCSSPNRLPVNIDLLSRNAV